MTLFDGFPPILRDFDVIKVVCVRYNLDRSYNCEIATLVSVTISHDLTALPSSMNRQPLNNALLLPESYETTIMS